MAKESQKVKIFIWLLLPLTICSNQNGYLGEIYKKQQSGFCITQFMYISLSRDYFFILFYFAQMLKLHV